MIVNDRIFGKVKVDDPLILEIINSPSFQRLKKISQFGPPDEFYHLKNFYRYEHCLGVMILLKKLGASYKEQIAGLLHDVSHTTFSHVIDWVIGNSINESFQDDKHAKFLEKSEIAGILKKYNLDPNEISSYKRFKLLERPIPDLCADRIDYSLREFPIKIAKKCFREMAAFENMIVFKDQQSAYLFASNFLKTQKNHWGGFEAVSRYQIFGNILKYAIDQKVINMEDFWKDEKSIIKKLKLSKDTKIEKVLNVLRNKSLANLPKSNKRSQKKFRHVDPYFIQKNELVRLSSADKQFKKELEKARKENKKGELIPLI